MIKRILAFLMVVCMACGSSAFAQEGIRVVLDGDRVPFDQPPIIVESRVLVPLRAIFEAVGATVTWQSETKTAFAMRGLTTVSISIGSNELYKNGQAISLDVPAQLINDRTLVPVRAIAESFDLRLNGNPPQERFLSEHYPTTSSPTDLIPRPFWIQMKWR